MNAIELGHAPRSIEIAARAIPSADPNAEVMVNLLGPLLDRMARRYEPDAQRRGDLQQEMLIALWLSLDTFNDKSSFQVWVNRVAHRVAAQHVAERRLSQRSERLSDRLERMPTPGDPELVFATRERALTLLNLLDGLCRREQEVVLLHLQEFELDEMSQAMRICRTQVRETLLRAKRRLTIQMRKTELRGASETSSAEPRQAPGAQFDVEPGPRRTFKSRPKRGARDESNLLFIEPQTKRGLDGRA